MKIGYVRVSTADQSGDDQSDQLRRAGAERIYREVASGSAARPKLAKLLEDRLRPGDKLIVVAWDRLARNLRDLIELADSLARLGVHLVSLREGTDTTTPAGRATFHVLGALAEMELQLLRERGRAGARVARRRGRLTGRAPALTAAEAELLRHERSTGRWTTAELAERYGVSPRTVRRYTERRTDAGPLGPAKPTPIEAYAEGRDEG